MKAKSDGFPTATPGSLSQLRRELEDVRREVRKEVRLWQEHEQQSKYPPPVRQSDPKPLPP